MTFVVESYFKHLSCRLKLNVEALNDAPSLEQSTEIVVTIEFEFDLAAFPATANRHMSAEALLQLGLPFIETVWPGAAGSSVMPAHSPPDVRLCPTH